MCGKVERPWPKAKTILWSILPVLKHSETVKHEPAISKKTSVLVVFQYPEGGPESLPHQGVEILGVNEDVAPVGGPPPGI